MRALRFDGTNFRLDASRPEPVPAPGEALVRPTLVALGRGDLNTGGAGRAASPAAVGGEFVGVVESVNIPEAVAGHASGVVGGAGPLLSAAVERARRLRGKRVVGSPVVPCMMCELCRSGLGGHCRARVVLGRGGREGCVAERLAIPAGNLHAVPDSVPDERAIFAVALATAAHAAQLFRAEGKPYITVLGDGLLALLCVQVMAKLNAKVRLLGWRAERFTLCERWAIKHRHADEVGRRNDQDVVIDASETTAGLTLALALVRPRGKVVVMNEGLSSGAAPGIALEAAGLGQIVTDEIELLGCRCGSIGEALAMLARGDVQTDALVTRRGKLDDAPAMLNAPAPAGTAPMLRVLLAA